LWENLEIYFQQQCNLVLDDRQNPRLLGEEGMQVLREYEFVPGAYPW